MNINPIQSKEDPLGFCCISTVNFWTPDTTIEDLLHSIFGLFYVANEDGAYGLDYKAEFRNNRELYNKKVKYFTQKYNSMKIKACVFYEFTQTHKQAIIYI